VNVRGELLALSRQLTALTKARPSLTAGVWGEAGIGKTHAARELLRGTVCRSLSIHARQDARLILEALTPRAPGVTALPAWLERALGRLKRGEELSPEQIAEALSALLSLCAPVILHIEDVHEAAGGPLELWAQLAPRVRRTRGVGLLVTSRSPLPPGFESLRLAPLDRAASDALLQGEVGAPLPGEALAWLYGRAAGNPLFTLEFLRMLVRQGALWNDGQRWRWRDPQGAALPITVEALIEQAWRRASASPAHDAVLGAKAVLGRGVGDSRWATVADLCVQEFQMVTEDLRRAGLLWGAEFAHPLYGEVIARHLPQDVRRTLARRALRALEADPCAAANFIEDAAPTDAEARALFTAAAQDALGHGHVTRAARLLARSLPYQPPHERAAMALQAALRLRHVDVAEAGRLAELATQNARTHGEAVFLLAELLAEQGRADDAERTLARLPDHERSGKHWIERLVCVRGAANNDAGVLALLREYPHDLAHPDAAATARLVRALAHDGRLAEATERVQQATQTSALTPEARVQLLKAASVVAYMRGDLAAMERSEAQVLDLAREQGDLRLQDAALFNRAIALEGLGRLAERMACLEEALEVCRELGDTVAHAIAQMSYATTLTEFGEYERAESMLLEARGVLQAVDLSAYLVDCEAALSQLYQDWQPPHGKLLALKHAEAALGHARRRNTTRLVTEGLCISALAETHAGHPERAWTLAREALEHAGTLDMPAIHTASLRALAGALGAAGHTAEARAALTEAHAVAGALGDETLVHSLALDLAHLNADDLAARHLLNWFEARALANLALRTRRWFPHLRPESPVAQGASLRLEVLGEMRTTQAGGNPPTPVRGRKRRELLGLLTEARLAGRTEVGKLDLLDALYPGLPDHGAQGALRDVVHQVREAHGMGVVHTTEHGYALGDVSTDAEDFLRGGDTALWRGAYLADVALERREDSVRDALVHALHGRAGELLGNHPGEAARLGRILLELDPYDLPALRLTLRALRAQANHRSLTRLYAQARARFLEVGEELPAAWPGFLGDGIGAPP
jgi:tetratricopeptide (TPR) repeat protein